ncbi:Tfp pilus assembly protein PilN [Micrococcales bacterium KH10]|nr:Tfp pilus assembly protein PilN [Micrococcales bacterium KH10]
MSPKAAAKARLWTILAVFVSLAFVVAGGLLGVQPLWQSADETNETAADQEAKNDREQIEVNRLRQQFEQIDDYRALLEELRVQVPTTLQTQEFQRQVAEIAETYDVSVTNLTFGTSSQVSITAAQADLATTPIESEARGGIDASSGSDETAAEENPDDNRPRFSDFYIMPVNIEVAGGYSDILEFLRGLQQNEKRIMLVSQVQGSSGGGESSSNNSSNEVNLKISGQISVLLDPEARSSIPDSENIEKPELPSTNGKQNPMTGSN